MIRLRDIHTLALLIAGAASAWADDEKAFQDLVYPVLDRTCYECHEPGISKGGVPFMEAETAEQIRSMRSVWRSVASQLRNHTMPPLEEEQPTDAEREQVVAWIHAYLKKTAPLEGPFAGNVTARRLNRLEYNNTVRDLVGVDLKFDETLPADGGTGEGFNNSGESLFLQPMLLERYLDAAQQIVDAAIVSPRQQQSVKPQDMRLSGEGTRFPLEKGQEVIALVTAYVEDDYDILLRIAKPERPVEVRLRIDGFPAQKLKLDPAKSDPDSGSIEERVRVRLVRGVHALGFVNLTEGAGVDLKEVKLRQSEFDISEQQKKTHLQLLGIEPGETPENPRAVAEKQLATFLKRAFRRPVEDKEVAKILQLYDRAAQRGDPWEEGMKLAIRGVLISPDFLFRMEQPALGKEIQPITNHELASRLSYFLWASMPDAELTRLADEGRLRDSEVLLSQVDRLLDDPRSLVFARDFVGQWLGTKDVGGRVAPITNEIQETYTPEIASDMREEVVLIFHHLLEQDRSVLELVNADYSFLTGRLARFYELENVKGLSKDRFQKVALKDQQRGGLLGTGAVLAMTSHYKQTSPVLRGAWVFDTLIGDPVPPPPPDVPELPKNKKGEKNLTDREKLALHRADTSCQACHNIIDPIGFALQNYDYIGKWRTQEEGQPVDTKGELPSGETFNGPTELKQVLTESRKEDLVRNLVRKLLGYALGRSLMDRDDATIEELISRVEGQNYSARELVRGIALSTPFQNRQLAE